ncbi:FcoT family thioesterase [Streptomyces sp. AV19]|uniref:(2E)-enoyl-ACP glycyltransferase n=1 Tax=Streptomyces sp. AV19 TaxID=2793068 RepID=UPI0018FE2237|nr:FcoT family thioesterase [Streptomyces sp. AV19]MBH1937505.1 FcoT family thioesterase [Streptomyces sp. AV19]MDG4533719.1 FcoT family thioesterase [Streptomyces sp. AV19]
MTAGPGAAPEFANDAELLERVLKPYKAHCKYLTSATVSVVDGRVTARCAFGIPESCYIDDTGHLNAVEVNISYNQMMYYAVAKSVKEKLLEEFGSWTLEDYWRHQLPDILIARFAGNFRRPINARAFSGEFAFASVERRAPGGTPMILADTRYRYWDDAGGRCDGEVKLAFVNAE